LKSSNSPYFSPISIRVARLMPFLLWSVAADTAQLQLVVTPAKQTIDITFEALPDLDELRALAVQQRFDNSFVRVRWTVPDEDRHQIDRAAIRALFPTAAEVKLEGLVVPVVRTRAAGIAQVPTIAAKVNRWAEATEAKPAPLLECLEQLHARSPEEIARTILEQPVDTEDSFEANAQQGDRVAREPAMREPVEAAAGLS
jgi:exonuclease SbcD